MPQITTIRVVRKRSVQPEQFGNAGAEVELTGNVLEGEDYKEVARQMLIDSRTLVYENLGMKLPKSVVDAVAEVDTPTETAKVEATTEEEKPKKRGRPKGSTKKKAAEEPKKEEPKDEDAIPGEETGEPEPEIRKNPENRKDPNADEDAVPGEETGEPESEGGEESDGDDGVPSPEEFNKYINDSIKSGKLTAPQAKQMMQEMKVARVRDLDTSEKVTKAKTMIDSFISANEAK